MTDRRKRVRRWKSDILNMISKKFLNNYSEGNVRVVYYNEEGNYIGSTDDAFLIIKKDKKGNEFCTVTTGIISNTNTPLLFNFNLEDITKNNFRSQNPYLIVHSNKIRGYLNIKKST